MAHSNELSGKQLSQQVRNEFCQKLLGKQTIDSEMLTHFYRELEICKLKNQIDKAQSKVYEHDNLQYFYSLKSNEQKLIHDQIFLKFIFQNNIKLSGLESKIFTTYLTKVKNKAKLSTEAIRAIDKVKLGLAPWHKGFYQDKSPMKLVVKLPKQWGDQKVFKLNDLISSFQEGSNNKVKTSQSYLMMNSTTYAYSYFEELYGSRVPASLGDYYTIEFNQLNTDLSILDKFNSLSSEDEKLLINDYREEITKRRSQLVID